MANPIYKEAIFSRCGLPVPVFADGHPAHSKYDPCKEAARLVQEVSPAGFFIVAGIGGGYFIDALQHRFPSSPIVAVEGTKEDIAYLASHFPIVRAAMNKKKAQCISPYSTPAFVSLSDMAAAVASLYIPALHGTLGIIEWESWAHSNASLLPLFREEVRHSQSIIAADASTQARFGKIWQRNILLNAPNACLQFTAKNPPLSLCEIVPATARRRSALIAAAGPSLDVALERIKRERGRLFIIATDTAYPALTGYGIASDVVVSIDGQQVSHAHFMTPMLGSPLFVMDICADNAAVSAVRKAGGKVFFVRTGHPLSTYLNINVPFLDAGGGTVTIAACDFARQAGFSNIIVCGADFAYIGGRPYARGTYLDTLYAINATRLSTAETAFSNLLMRTPLIPMRKENSLPITALDASKRCTADEVDDECADDKCGSDTECIPRAVKRVTTSVLSSYRASFEAWMEKHGFCWESNNGSVNDDGKAENIANNDGGRADNDIKAVDSKKDSKSESEGESGGRSDKVYGEKTVCGGNRCWVEYRQRRDNTIAENINDGNNGCYTDANKYAATHGIYCPVNDELEESIRREGYNTHEEYNTHEGAKTHKADNPHKRGKVYGMCNDYGFNEIARWIRDAREALDNLTAMHNATAPASFAALPLKMMSDLMPLLPCAAFFRAKDASLDALGALQCALNEAEKCTAQIDSNTTGDC